MYFLVFLFNDTNDINVKPKCHIYRVKKYAAIGFNTLSSKNIKTNRQIMAIFYYLFFLRLCVCVSFFC